MAEMNTSLWKAVYDNQPAVDAIFAMYQDSFSGQVHLSHTCTLCSNGVESFSLYAPINWCRLNLSLGYDIKKKGVDHKLVCVTVPHVEGAIMLRRMSVMDDFGEVYSIADPVPKDGKYVVEFQSTNVNTSAMYFHFKCVLSPHVMVDAIKFSSDVDTLLAMSRRHERPQGLADYQGHSHILLL